jgi:hypothetical protein
MATDIVHGANMIFIVSADDDRVFTNIEQEEITLFGDLTDMPRIKPTLKDNISSSA